MGPAAACERLQWEPDPRSNPDPDQYGRPQGRESYDYLVTERQLDHLHHSSEPALGGLI